MINHGLKITNDKLLTILSVYIMWRLIYLLMPVPIPLFQCLTGNHWELRGLLKHGKWIVYNFLNNSNISSMALCYWTSITLFWILSISSMYQRYRIGYTDFFIWRLILNWSWSWERRWIIKHSWMGWETIND